MKTTLPVVTVITSCTREPCGACCSSMGFVPVTSYVGPFAWDDPSELPPELLAELEAKREALRNGEEYADDAPCMWLDGETRRCRFYQYRPSVCRTEIEPGDQACLKWRHEKGIE